MAQSITILHQLTALFSRHDFENLAIKQNKGQTFCSFNRWSQFVAMMIVQLSGRKSLRDLVNSINAQGADASPGDEAYIVDSNIKLTTSEPL